MGNPQSVMEFHEVADIFPMMAQSEFQALCDDIAENGLRLPIVVYDHKIIDGRNRYLACQKLGIEPEFTQWDRKGLVVDYIVSMNLRRRHLNESQRAMVAARLANIKPGDNQYTMDTSIDVPISQHKAAEMLNVSVPSVQRARQVLETGSPELIKMVDKGEIPVSVASKTRDFSVLFSSETPNWNTPKQVIERVLKVFGEIDLDPCSDLSGNPNVPAKEYFTVDDDGLNKPWHGKVYMNPPYGYEIENWIIKLCKEYEDGRTTEAIVLVAARTDTQWWLKLSDYPVCFVIGRLKFGIATNSAPFPSAIFYLGNNFEKFYNSFKDIGKIWQQIGLNGSIKNDI